MSNEKFQKSIEAIAESLLNEESVMVGSGLDEREVVTIRGTARHGGNAVIDFTIEGGLGLYSVDAPDVEEIHPLKQK